MNADHKDALILLAKRYAGIDAQQGEMTAVDRLGLPPAPENRRWREGNAGRILPGSERYVADQRSIRRNGTEGAPRIGLGLCGRIAARIQIRRPLHGVTPLAEVHQFG